MAENKSGATPDFTRETRVLHQVAALCRDAASAFAKATADKSPVQSRPVTPSYA
jgi:hypothetical protein